VRLHPAIICAAAVVACAVAGLSATAPSAVNAFLPNRTFGLGEQQVYVIERDQRVVVRYRNANDDIVTKTLTRKDTHSVALTVEAYASGGGAVLGVTAETTPASGASSTSASPMVGVDGAISAPGPLEQLAAAAVIVGAQPSAPLADGSKWSGGGTLALPIGAVKVRVANAATAWNGDPSVLQVTSAGTLEPSGSLDVKGLGKVALRGNGTCNGVSFLDMTDALLIGANFTLASRGNVANSRGTAGDYTLNATYTLKLARFIPGRMPPVPLATPVIPGLMRSAPPDSNVINQGAADQVAHPAPTDNIFSGSPLPVVTATPMPEQSMPPVPIPVASDAALASPPAPPPTPFPTFTPH
jgi:hypothetical protein